MTAKELATVTARIDAEAAKIGTLSLKVDQVIALLSRGGTPAPSVGGGGTPVALAMVTQPVGAASGSVLATLPVVKIVDNAGATCTSATNAVTAAIQTGSGTLSGTLTVNAVAGIATFTNLVVTGAGTDTLLFSASGLSSVISASVTISPQGSGLWPNLPAGMTIIQQNDTGYSDPPVQVGGAWTGMPQTGNPSGWGVLNENGYLSLVTMAGAPVAPTKVLRARYPSGFSGGPGVGTCYYYHDPVPTRTEMYWGVIWQVASPYTFSNVGAQKIVYGIWDESASPSTLLACELGGDGPTIADCEFSIIPVSFPVDEILHAGTDAGTTKTVPAFDTWYMLEYYAKYSTGASHENSDGIVTEWVSKWNGSSWAAPAKNIDRRNLVYPNNAGATLVELYTGWSGTATKAEEDYTYYDGNIIAAA